MGIVNVRPQPTDHGLFWTTTSARAPAAPLIIARRPDITWTPPESFPSLKGIKRLGFDVETKDPDLKEQGSGCRRPGNYPVGYSIAHEIAPGHTAKYYFPIRHEGGGNLDPQLVLDWLRIEMRDFDGDIVGANLGYDLDWAAADDIAFPNVRRFLDVQIAEPLLDENKQGQYNLGALAQHHLGITKNEALLTQAAASFGLDPKRDLWRLPAGYVGPYAEDDAALVLDIMAKQEIALERDGLTDLFLNIETPLVPILVAMRRRGVRVDMATAEQARRKLVQQRTDLLAQMRHLAGPRAEFMAPASFAHAFKMPVARTGAGNVSVTKNWLERNAPHDPLAAVVLKGRRVNTTINLFFDGHIMGHVNHGRIHCTFNQLKGDEGGTIARFSSSDPNLQNLPARDEELAPLVRGIFLPEDGEIWERLDWSQIEYRFLAHYAVGGGADACRAAYTNDPKTDYHKMCAEFCGIDPEDKIKRKRVKNINFAKGYGAGAKTLAGHMQCSEDEARTFIKQYNEALPFALATYEKAESVANERGIIRTIAGRLAHFDLWEPRWKEAGAEWSAKRHDAALEAWGPRIRRAFTYKALNRLLQGSAADLMKKAMVMREQAGIGAILGPSLITCHDELGESKPATVAGENAMQELQHIMEHAIPLRVPVIAERESGTSWGSCK